MSIHALTRQLFTRNNSKIVMYVGDGLGGLPQSPGGKTELETALLWAVKAAARGDA